MLCHLMQPSKSWWVTSAQRVTHRPLPRRTCQIIRQNKQIRGISGSSKNLKASFQAMPVPQGEGRWEGILAQLQAGRASTDSERHTLRRRGAIHMTVKLLHSPESQMSGWPNPGGGVGQIAYPMNDISTTVVFSICKCMRSHLVLLACYENVTPTPLPLTPAKFISACIEFHLILQTLLLP